MHTRYQHTIAATRCSCSTHELVVSTYLVNKDGSKVAHNVDHPCSITPVMILSALSASSIDPTHWLVQHHPYGTCKSPTCFCYRWVHMDILLGVCGGHTCRYWGNSAGINGRSAPKMNPDLESMVRKDPPLLSSTGFASEAILSASHTCRNHIVIHVYTV